MSAGHHHHHHHGNVFVGRIMVAVGCLFILGASALVFMAARETSHPLPVLQLITVVTLIWMFVGAWGMCTRKAWTRYLVLTILYIGTIGYFMAGVISFSMDDSPLAGREKPIFIATAVFLYISLVFTHSRHIRRLTSRAWE